MRLELLLLILAIAILAGIWLIFRRRQNPQSLSPGKTTHLQQKLNRMLSGDRVTAARLVKQAKIKYPGKSQTWYWEKVIEDLERDRR